MIPAGNPLLPYLDLQGTDSPGLLVLDGGLATTLEEHGHSLDDDLWSARLLLEDPDAIRQVHREFLDAGADCITTASYQASLAGFRKKGLDDNTGLRLLQLSVHLALQARDEFSTTQPAGRLRPLVAASVGPYGAFLADGAEYHGHYGITRQALSEFHAQRWQALAHSGADLLACETIPSHQEVSVLLSLLERTPEVWAWMSVTCADGNHLRDGSELVAVMAECHAQPRIAAVAINCTAPEHIPECIRQVRSVTDKPLLVYPNSGEHYDAVGRRWEPSASMVEWSAAADQWFDAGAQGVGGCCRVGPHAVAEIRACHRIQG